MYQTQRRPFNRMRQQGVRRGRGGTINRRQVPDLSEKTCVAIPFDWKMHLSKKVTYYPIKVEQLDEAPIKEAIDKATHVAYRCSPFTLADGDDQGWLELIFKTAKQLEESDAKIKKWEPALKSEVWKYEDQKIQVHPRPPTMIHRTLLFDGLPQSTTEEQLLEAYGGFEALLLNNPDGKSSVRGFVEFCTDEEAASDLEANPAIMVAGMEITPVLAAKALGRSNDIKLTAEEMKQLVGIVVSHRTKLVKFWKTLHADQMGFHVAKLARVTKVLEMKSPDNRWRDMLREELAKVEVKDDTKKIIDMDVESLNEMVKQKKAQPGYTPLRQNQGPNRMGMGMRGGRMGLMRRGMTRGMRGNMRGVMRGGRGRGRIMKQ